MELVLSSGNDNENLCWERGLWCSYLMRLGIVCLKAFCVCPWLLTQKLSRFGKSMTSGGDDDQGSKNFPKTFQLQNPFYATKSCLPTLSTPFVLLVDSVTLGLNTIKIASVWQVHCNRDYFGSKLIKGLSQCLKCDIAKMMDLHLCPRLLNS